MKICISGDSWGCGEWDRESAEDKETVLVHKGLEYFLSNDDHQVCNVSSPGASNKTSIALLKDQLQTEQFDHIFWFQSDPIRDYRPYDFLKQKEVTVKQLLQLSSDTLYNNYESLNSIGKPIYCIGGATKLAVNMMSNFNNLRPFIPSLTEFLLGDKFTHPEIWISDWGVLVDRQFDDYSMDKIVEYKRIQDSLITHKELFYPDGWHPNRKGFEILYEYIKCNLGV